MLENILSAGLNELGLPATAEQTASFRAYADLLCEKNKVMNLTAITQEDEVARLHFLDCAALCGCYDFSGKTAADIGTGAGFPGLVIKILNPSVHLTLLDSLDKRVGFLKEVCSELKLADVECIHARAEEIPAGRREAYDVVMSRAVADLRVLAELCLPYVRQDGVFMAMKGPDFEEELERAKPAIKLLGGKTERCEKYTIPGTDITHSVIIIKKTGSTPAKYPRRWAQIKKSPI